MNLPDKFGRLLSAVAALAVLSTVGAAPMPQQAAQQRFAAAEAAYADGDTLGALSILDELVARYPMSRYPSDPWRAAASVRAGEIELTIGRAQSASSRARLGLATTLLWSRDWAASARLLQQVVDSFEANDSGADVLAGAAARDRLTLLDRLWLRVAAGQVPWQTAGRFALGMDVQRPIGISAGPNGLLVSDEATDTVVFRDSIGNAAGFSVPDPQRPWWGARGQSYVPSAAGVSDPLGATSFQFAFTDGSRQRNADDIRAGARTPAGDWVVLDNRSDQVLRFEATGAFKGALELRGGEPLDVEIGPRGRTFVLEKSRREVMVFAPDGTFSSSFGIDTWREPYAMAVDAIGHVYVLDRGNKRIDVFDPAAGMVWSIGPALPGGFELDDPRDLAVDASGRIFIADRGFGAVVVIE
jgi:hypothetical protein